MAKKVALVFGGRSLESDISVITAMQTLATLKETEFIVEPVYLTEGGFYMCGLDDIAAFMPFERDKHLRVILADGVFLSVRRGKLRREFRPDVALICCHGGEGENGVLQGLLEFNGVPYTSAGVTASAVCMDKAASKCVFEQMLLNVLPYVTVRSSDALSDPYAVTLVCERTLDYPVIVKPASQGSSIGISAAHDREELAEALAVAARFDDKLVVEEKLTDFVEVNCAAYARGGEVIVSETERPLSAGELLTFEDKYVSGGKMSGGGREMPAPVGDELNALVKKDSRWGRIVCRCEKVTEAEIVAAVHSPVPARTVDAVKRRVRAGMGRCQGGFCSTRVMEIISEELGIPMREIRKGAGHSEIAVLAVKEADYDEI